VAGVEEVEPAVDEDAHQHRSRAHGGEGVDVDHPVARVAVGADVE
jgi:hypothetical protein